ncbi:MAG: YARHG domain-containing protein [Bacteroidaceae bacterium]|nr:YARHG domain-containing protein [Bacteroidaceae bacterium]
MKHSVLFILCLFTLAGMQAQDIRTGSKWNVGSLDYTAKVNSDRTITFSATAEGEELAFRLTPTPGKTDEYTIGTEPNSEGFNPFEKSTRAKFINQQGWRLLCLYDANNYLLNILDATQSINGEKVAVGKWMEQISGKYIDHYGDTLQIGHETIYERGVARATYENITFNGCVTGVVKISGLTNLEGKWEIVQTLNGLTLYQVEQDEYGMFTRKGEKETLTWVNSEPRFGYANRILLNDREFSKLKKSTLRIMRNSILAVHSYMVSSPDLVEYFGNQPWFSPRPSNDDVYDELTLVERLNIELIKAEENNPSHGDYIKEP